jgi:hypothetical protein
MGQMSEDIELLKNIISIETLTLGPFLFGFISDMRLME